MQCTQTLGTWNTSNWKILGLLAPPNFFSLWVDFSSQGASLGALASVLLLLDLTVKPCLYGVVVPIWWCFFSTFMDRVCTSSKDQYGCNCTTLLIDGFNPPKYLAIVCSSGSTNSHFNMSWSNFIVYAFIDKSLSCRLWSFKNMLCGGRYLHYISFFILGQVVILLFPSGCRRRFRFSYHKQALFLNCMATNFTFLSCWTPLYLKTHLAVWSSPINSYESIQPLKFNKSAFTPKSPSPLLYSMPNWHNISSSLLEAFWWKGFSSWFGWSRCCCGWLPHVASFQRAFVAIGEFLATCLLY